MSMTKFDSEIIGATKEYKDLKKEIKVELQKEEKKPRKKKSKRKYFKVFFYLSFLILCTCVLLFMMGLHKSTIVSLTWVIPTIILSVIILLISGSYLILVKPKKKHSNVISTCVLTSYLLIMYGVTFLFYGSYGVKDFIINKALASMNYQYIASFFYDNKTINQIASSHQLEPESQTIYEDLVSFEDIKLNQPEYVNQYEEAVLSNKENAPYKIIKVEGTLENTDYHYEGFLAVIYDPSKVKLAVSSGMGIDETAYGEIIPTMAKREKAILAMNAGGFYDPDWMSNGGIPHGPVIKDGVLLTNFRQYPANGGIIGFNNENKLVLLKVSGEEAVQMGVRDAVDWGPFLIINGENQQKNSAYTWALARTAIGQRKDGIVLMLVIDGLQEHSKGATFYEMAKIMERYGAYNAANLDGGTSASLWANGDFINIPFNGEQRTIRRLPNAWIVVE